MTLSKRECVSNRLTDDQFPIKKEEAANLGLQALAGIVDGMILTHVQGRIQQGETEAKGLKKEIEGSISLIGTPPSSLPLDVIKEAAKEHCVYLFYSLLPKEQSDALW